MQKVGVTGGIGSGKTLICRIFGVLGIPVFDADREAKRLMTGDLGLVAAITDAFGDEAYSANGSLNRAYLAETVFNNEAARKRLNELVHPVVIRAGEEWAAAQHAPYTIKEAALLFESGSYKKNNYNILVTAPEDLRIQRVMERDGTTERQVRARMASQWPEEKKAAFADFIITNDGIQALIPQVRKLHDFFLQLR
ncbi:dephospho-CoA kinase [Parapedobacter lycopersici]|uniref:dephospho-CoA kinase n=1 Tax=Parapedobacter lycopersici TaxID=1864939 RepID=UPI00214D47B1|nr:dephospho-CoA kinase [Parapedobacter lycopersici]